MALGLLNNFLAGKSVAVWSSPKTYLHWRKLPVRMNRIRRRIHRVLATSGQRWSGERIPEATGRGCGRRSCERISWVGGGGRWSGEWISSEFVTPATSEQLLLLANCLKLMKMPTILIYLNLFETPEKISIETLILIYHTRYVFYDNLPR